MIEDRYSQEPTISEKAAQYIEQREAEVSELEALMQMRPGLLNNVSVLDGVIAQDTPEELESARQAQIDNLSGLDEEFRISEQYAAFFTGEDTADVEW